MFVSYSQNRFRPDGADLCLGVLFYKGLAPIEPSQLEADYPKLNLIMAGVLGLINQKKNSFSLK